MYKTVYSVAYEKILVSVCHGGGYGTSALLPVSGPDGGEIRAASVAVSYTHLRAHETVLLLWFHTVLPTLLPFMLCSSAIVAFGAVPAITRPLAPLFSRLSLSENGSYALMAGILCGYPMGPKTAADFLAEEEISTEEARYLLAVSAWPSSCAGRWRPPPPRCSRSTSCSASASSARRTGSRSARSRCSRRSW